MVSKTDPSDYKDALFLSPHKFVGGPGSPGVLAIRMDLLKGTKPSSPGGGTVSFVTDDSHQYLDDPVSREESGTPDIIGSIRAGLAFNLKSSVGVREIERRESVHLTKARTALSANPNVEILGSDEAKRLSILSLRIGRGGEYFHHNYVVALLNDLFGIQARGGCSCANPYGLRLLGIDQTKSNLLKEIIDQGWIGLKPGWVRVNFNYFISDEVLEYITSALSFIAKHGMKFITDYYFDPLVGRWWNKNPVVHEAMDFYHLTSCWRDASNDDLSPPLRESDLRKYLQTAEDLAAARSESVNALSVEITTIPSNVESLRDFIMPVTCVYQST